jgi:hypothetical protein
MRTWVMLSSWWYGEPTAGAGYGGLRVLAGRLLAEPVVARTHLAITVELVHGAHAQDLWPRPGPALIAARTTTFGRSPKRSTTRSPGGTATATGPRDRRGVSTNSAPRPETTGINGK